ncbi:MAG: ATPase, T2SS/T4P/T4SS family [Candidatus Omnitrophica bacterium]|nr:ATPase, T2SS/T4P/T4SS family [Candidatus Omnitrophota bacterium]
MAGVDRRRIGDILIEDGMITPEQLNEALELQKGSIDDIAIGEVLIQLGHLSEEGLSLSLSKKLKIKYLSFSDYSLEIRYDQGLDKLIGEEFARMHLVLPISKTQKAISISMWDPLNFVCIDNIKRMTLLDVTVYCSTKKDILEGIERLYVLKGPPVNGYAASAITVDQKPPVARKEEVEQLKMKASEPPIIKLVNMIIQRAIKDKASDIHIEPTETGIDIRYRIDGILYAIDTPSKDMYAPIVSRIKILSRLDIAEKRLPQDGGFSIKIDNRTVDFRVSTIPTIYGEKIVIRILDKEKMGFDLSSIGMSKPDFLKVSTAIKKPYGLIFITGPTGSGKTTTLYCILNSIKSPQKNLITIEDPVEYKIEGVNQVQEMSSIGLSFGRGLRAFLRQDPDIIMVGEVRDLETAEMAVRSALVGRLILSTLHTNDAVGAISRLLDMGIEPFLVSSTLIMVIAQRLVRRLCPECKKRVKNIDKTTIDKYKLAGATLYEPKGCSKCNNRGFSGRIAVFEILIADPEIQELIEKRADITVIKSALIKKGMKLLRDDAMEKVREGQTTLNEAIIATME